MSVVNPGGVKAKATRSARSREPSWLARIWYFGAGRRQNFYEDMRSFVDVGIPPAVAIRRMHDVYKPRKSQRGIVLVAAHALARLDAGASLAEALGNWIPPEEKALIAAGDQSGALSDAMKELSALLGTKRQIRSSLMSSLGPAAMKLAILVALMVYILNTVIKEARSLIPDEYFSRLVLAPLYFNGGAAFLEIFPIALTLLAIGSVVVAISLSKWRPTPGRKWLDRRLPPYTLYARIQASFLLITASSMMGAGQTLQGSLNELVRASSPWVQSHVRRMLSNLSAGRDEVRAMQTGMLPIDVEDRLAIYASLPDFVIVMRSCARDSAKTLLSHVDAIGKVINNAVMIALGVFMLLTIFSIGEIALELQSVVGSAS